MSLTGSWLNLRATSVYRLAGTVEACWPGTVTPMCSTHGRSGQKPALSCVSRSVAVKSPR
eukprot:1690963-Pleurochrysis_carterae.AAC.1